MSKSTISAVENLPLRKSEDLAKLAEMLGYKHKGKYATNQFQCSNGSFVSSLCDFLDDNPGAMEAVREWVLEHREIPNDLKTDGNADILDCIIAEKHLKIVDADGLCLNCAVEDPPESEESNDDMVDDDVPIKTVEITSKEYFADPRAVTQLAEKVGRVVISDKRGIKRLTINSNRSSELLLDKDGNND